ncbi:sialic acid-binding Ig-like lectin 14 isoform X2 [Ictalurus furcatus]|uniref:sialic acid-binding Ig-like lectin 14 isoform X2 n=1 Tax=Ictalurus furcatus TaxID=66913 RepID=UPI0023510112|nr:sialic acid-binding Ig-like lectin 14 isoform X2 [Ictalurus furcatus]
MNAAEKLIFICCLFQGVLCREFSISLPESVEAVRGLCVLIPCSFEIEEQFDGDLQTDPTGIWLKDGTHDNNNRVFNSKVTDKVNKIEGKLIGDLRMKNCTTIFYNIRQNYSGVYYFRIETSGRLKWNYIHPSESVRVGASPITPSITLYKEDQGKVEDQNELVEGTSVSLICSAPAPPCLLKPPTFTWNFLPEERRQEQNHNTSFSSSQLNFNATHLHHGLNFTCTATYQLQNRNKSAQSSFILHVLYGPRNTSVSASPSASVLLGSSVSLRCSSDANPAVLNYTWYRENGEQIGTGNHLTINTTDSTHSGLYYCRAQNQHGDHNSSVLLDVQYAPQLSPSSSCNTTQDLIMCSCEVHGNPSPKLEWRVSGQNSSATSEESVNKTTSRSFISIRQSFTDVLTLQCVGSNNLGISTQFFYFKKVAPHSAKVKYPDVDISSVLIGAAVGASVMMMLCGLFLCVRRVNPSQSGRGDSAGLVLNDRAVRQEEEGESVYANRRVSSESLHYSTVRFPNRTANENTDLPSLTADYATVHHGSKQQDNRRMTKTEVKEKDSEQIKHSDGDEVLYAQVKPRKSERKM